jgi:hypothetical protein
MIVLKTYLRSQKHMKATFPDGTLFEGTTEEYITIRNHSVVGNGQKPTAKPINSSDWNERRARAFWESLDIWHNGGRQKKLLEFLIKNGGRATEGEVWKELSIEKGQELAGVLANLTRNARRETNDRVKATHWIRDPKGVFHCCISDDLLQFLKEIV